MPFHIVGSKATINFDNDQYILSLSKIDVLGALAECLKAARSQWPYASRMATSIIVKAADKGWQCWLEGMVFNSEFLLEIITSSIHAPIKLIQFLPKEKKVLFYGSVEGFLRFVEECSSLKHLVGKTVQFKYAGGSCPNTTRTVRVEHVKSNEAGVITISGLDLVKLKLDTCQGQPTVKDGWRQYTADKIVGEIVVLA